MVSTVGGKGAILFDHPLSAASWIEDRHTTALLEKADVLLAVGTAMGEVTSNYFTFAPEGRLIHVDAEPRVLEANHPGLGIHADAALALTAIAKQVRRRDTADGPGIASGLRRAVQDRLAGQDLATELALMTDLRAAVPTATQTFWDMTIAAYWAWSAWDPRDGQFHSAQGAGGLGYAFPAAIAAAIGSGERTFAVSGDGGAMYSIAELATARQHNAEVTWLIVDDGGYGIREYMTDAFGEATATERPGPISSRSQRVSAYLRIPRHSRASERSSPTHSPTTARPSSSASFPQDVRPHPPLGVHHGQATRHRHHCCLSRGDAGVRILGQDQNQGLSRLPRCRTKLGPSSTPAPWPRSCWAVPRRSAASASATNGASPACGWSSRSLSACWR